MKKNNNSSKFLSIPEDFIFFGEKILINKLELSKAINVNAQSGEVGYAFIAPSHDRKTQQKDEDATVIDMQKWLEDQQDHLEEELKKLYPEL